MVKDEEQSLIKTGDKGNLCCPPYWARGHLLPQGGTQRGGGAGAPGPLAWMPNPSVGEWPWKAHCKEGTPPGLAPIA